MRLRTKISLATWLGRFGGAIALVLAGTSIAMPVIGLILGAVWLLGGERILHELVLPRLFPKTVCPGCGRTIPLVGRWKCGGHYTDHRDRHILAFYCSHGHVLESFDCPRCKSTILVQKGDPQIYRHGSAFRLRTLTTMPAAEDNALLIGHDEYGRSVGLPEDRLAWHVAITGGTGRGKSTLLANLAGQLARSGAGFTVLDPGGDLARTVVQQIPEERISDVLYLDVGEREHPFPLNVLSAQDDIERAMLSEELLGVFHRLYGSAWGPLLAHQLRMALQAVIVTGGTLADVYGLFVDARTRARVVEEIRDPALRLFWTEEFPAIPAIRRSAVVNKLAPVVFHPLLGPILCAKTCVLDADVAIAERQIVVVNLATGTPAEDVTTLLGTFLVQKVLAAAFRQFTLPPAQRIRHTLIVDEFQRFMHRAAAFDQILAESRKFKLSLVVANQYVEQLALPVRAALFGNIGCLAAFRVGHRDARVLTPEFNGAIPEDLLELEIGQCLVRIGTAWTTVRTLPPPARPEHDPTIPIISATRQKFPPEPAEEIIAVDGEETSNDEDEDDEVEFVQ